MKCDIDRKWTYCDNYTVPLRIVERKAVINIPNVNVIAVWLFTQATCCFGKKIMTIFLF